MINPLVSVCVPNYNNAKYLDACLQSALDQTYDNNEVIFLDDGSTDNSISIAQKYENRVRIFRNDMNCGQPMSTNRCLEYARGEYIVILHSDDMLLPHFAEKLVSILNQYPQVGMAVGERLETDETGMVRNITPFYNIDCVIPGERQAKVFLFMSFLPCQVLFRREMFNKVGGIDLRHIVNLDGLMWFKCALEADVAYIREPVGIYRVHGESTTAYYNRSIDHMLEYYATLSEMFRLGRARPYLEQFFESAVKRVGQLTLRYCHGVFRDGNYDLALRFLTLAKVFDPEIDRTHAWRTMKYCAEATEQNPGKLYSQLLETMTPEVRSHSYDPPDGYLPLVPCID